MSDATRDLQAAVAELHAALDGWHAAVEGVAAESDDDATHALADPRLEAAQDRFYDRLGAFETATLPVLGLVALEGDGSGDAAGADPTVDDFAVHVVVALDEGASRDLLDKAMEIVDEAGTELGARLTAAGFHIVELETARGELSLGADDDDAP